MVGWDDHVLQYGQGDWIRDHVMRILSRLFEGGMLERVGDGWRSSLHAKVPVGLEG